MNKVLILGYALFLILGEVFGQTSPAFQSLGDASGQPLSERNSLIGVANDLRKLVKDTTAENFTVFDVGLYPLNDRNSESDDYAQAFEDAKKKAKSLSKYYLIFGREHTKDKVNSSVIVHCEIPDSSQLTCVFVDSRNLLDQQLTTMFSESMLQGLSIEAAETKVMYAFRAWLLDKFNCCFQRSVACGTCRYPNEMVEYLQSNGFEAFDCKVVNAATNEIILYDSLIILDKALSLWTENGVSVQVTKDTLCNPSGGNILTFNSNADRTAVSLWFHIWKNPDGSGRDQLFRSISGAVNLIITDPEKVGR